MVPGPRHHSYTVELKTKVAEDYEKFYNYREGPYKDLLLVEST